MLGAETATSQMKRRDRPFHHPAIGRTSEAISIDVLHLPASRSEGAGAGFGDVYRWRLFFRFADQLLQLGGISDARDSMSIDEQRWRGIDMICGRQIHVPEHEPKRHLTFETAFKFRKIDRIARLRELT